MEAQKALEPVRRGDKGVRDLADFVPLDHAALSVLGTGRKKNELEMILYIRHHKLPHSAVLHELVVLVWFYRLSHERVIFSPSPYGASRRRDIPNLVVGPTDLFLHHPACVYLCWESGADADRS
jgi:hypothetical protein